MNVLCDHYDRDSNGLAHLALCNSTDTWIIAQGYTSNKNCCKRFHFNEKVEKHWN